MKYVEGVLDVTSLENEILKMWRRLYKLLTETIARIESMAETKEVKGNVVYVNGKPILNIFVHNLGAFVRRAVTLFLNI